MRVGSSSAGMIQRCSACSGLIHPFSVKHCGRAGFLVRSSIPCYIEALNIHTKVLDSAISLGITVMGVAEISTQAKLRQSRRE